jgi:hypothetical protein
MKAYGGVDVWFHVFLTPAVFGAEWADSEIQLLIRQKAGWAPERTGRCGEEESFYPIGIRTQTPACPARSQWLYRLRYLGSLCRPGHVRTKWARPHPMNLKFLTQGPCILISATGHGQTHCAFCTQRPGQNIRTVHCTERPQK